MKLKKSISVKIAQSRYEFNFEFSVKKGCENEGKSAHRSSNINKVSRFIFV